MGINEYFFISNTIRTYDDYRTNPPKHTHFTHHWKNHSIHDAPEYKNVQHFAILHKTQCKSILSFLNYKHFLFFVFCYRTNWWKWKLLKQTIIIYFFLVAQTKANFLLTILQLITKRCWKNEKTKDFDILYNVHN